MTELEPTSLAKAMMWRRAGGASRKNRSCKATGRGKLYHFKIVNLSYFEPSVIC